MARAAWLEAHDDFEGVGAHELNPRYEHVDADDGYDFDLEAEGVPAPHTSALMRAQGFAAGISAKPRLDGPDVSHYQYDAGPFSWDQVAAAPCTWGATKLSQSVKYLDPTAGKSRGEMARVGMVHRGLYHWLSSTTDPAQQAVWFLSRVGVLADGEFAMLDAEEAGINVAGVLAWCERVESATRRPVVVYSGAFVSGGSIWTDPRVRASSYGVRPMILAAYTSEAKAKALPGVAKNPWQAWQFSSNGPVPGVTGRCDMNRVDSRAAFDLASRPVQTPPQPHPAPIPPTTPPRPDDSEADDMDIVTNKDQFFAEPPLRWKAVVTSTGKLRHLTETEWIARGSKDGVALSNEQIAELGVG